VTRLFSVKATPAAVLARLPDHRFAHIVCHGILEPGKPFESSFKLHRGERLPLLDTVRSQLPDAEFAFLSACHTAGLTEESIADEVENGRSASRRCGETAKKKNDDFGALGELCSLRCVTRCCRFVNQICFGTQASELSYQPTDEYWSVG